MYVQIYVCMYAYMCIYMYACVYTCARINFIIATEFALLIDPSAHPPRFVKESRCMCVYVCVSNPPSSHVSAPPLHSYSNLSECVRMYVCI